MMPTLLPPELLPLNVRAKALPAAPTITHLSRATNVTLRRLTLDEGDPPLALEGSSLREESLGLALGCEPFGSTLTAAVRRQLAWDRCCVGRRARYCQRHTWLL